ncbi:MAG: acyl-CoA dehydrogenase family protein [Dehalococcoidia bacterium]|nr:acyl-CoA dehydrogenase family protein [Dehalococcoidia bacterium]
MRFTFTPEQEQFRNDVRAFLDETLTPAFWQHHRQHRLPGWSPEFSRATAERGWLATSWPVEYGGLGLGAIEQSIYMEEMAYAGAPQEHHRRAIQQVGPSIMLFGTPEQKADYLPRIASAEISFAMGLSEPNAGSDLANVETMARRDGDDYVINGVKRYTSGAHYSDYLWCVARTDPNAPKHRGISMIAVPLQAAGVEVRPLLDLQGDHHFNYVYLNDVRVPIRNRVGEENRGWYVNAQTMDYERSGGAHIGSSRRLVDQAVRWVRDHPQHPLSDGDRGRLADIVTMNSVAWLLGYRVAWMRSEGLFPNHEASMVKLLTAHIRQAVPNLLLHIMGPAGLTSDAEGWGIDYLESASATVGQGTSEIQRNVIATRGLGLPRG